MAGFASMVGGKEGWRTVMEKKEEIATEVVEWGRTDDVIYEHYRRGILTKTHFTRLRELSTRKEQVRKLMEVLASGTICTDTLAIFLEVLQMQGMGQLVDTLHAHTTSHTHSEENSSSQQGSSMAGLRNTPYFHQSEGRRGLIPPQPPSTLSLPQLPTTPDSSTPEDSRNNNNNNNNNSTTEGMAKKSLKISVVPYREVGGKQYLPCEVYKNLSQPRGLVFLANYKDFHDEQHQSRLGSELDTKRLIMLFTQMGYKIEPHINMNRYETIQALREFRNLQDHSSMDSCIAVFMSHGRDDKTFFTSDNNYLGVSDVVERFSNRECPQLKGKPKIFIFQYCRGQSPDVGVMDSSHQIHNVNQSGISVETDASGFGEVLIKKDPTFTDMYIVYSTIGGFASFRDPVEGSWLVEAICEVFMKDACDTELEHLMKKVSRQVRSKEHSKGGKQACEFVQLAFDRHFYFNPQHLNTMSSLNLASLSHALPSIPGTLSPMIHHRRIKTRSSSRCTTPDPKMPDARGARSRNPSGASNYSEEGAKDKDEVDYHMLNTYALHPRVKSINASHRRLSVPEPYTQKTDMLQGCMTRGRSFSELNTEVASPEPLEGAIGWASSEVLSTSPCESPQHHMAKTFPVKGYSEFMHAAFPQDVPMQTTQENFPLMHSQSALEPISTSDIGVTGVGPEVGSSEGMRSPFKRQLSVPSNNETLQKVNDVRRYLQIHDSDPNLHEPLKRIESFINKKKNEGKRRKKGEPSSLDY